MSSRNLDFLFFFFEKLGRQIFALFILGYVCDLAWFMAVGSKFSHGWDLRLWRNWRFTGRRFDVDRAIDRNDGNCVKVAKFIWKLHCLTKGILLLKKLVRVFLIFNSESISIFFWCTSFCGKPSKVRSSANSHGTTSRKKSPQTLNVILNQRPRVHVYLSK